MTPPATGWSEATAANVRWWIAPELTTLLLGPQGFRLDDWLRNGQAQIIKQGPHRVVYRVHLDHGQVFYVKHNLLPDVRSWLRQLVRPSKARMEFDRAVAIAARGVATVEPLALGERRAFLGACDSYLVTRSLEGAQALNSFLAMALTTMAPRRHALVRQRLARALGRFVARLHDAGILHNDLHAANILVQLPGGDEPLLYLVDLNAVRLGPALDWKASRDNLVLLTRWFVSRVSRTDRLRFWRAYYEARGLGQWPRRPHGHQEHFLLARHLEQLALESTWAFWKNRDPRCFANNRYFRRLRVPGVAGHAVADLDLNVLAPLLADPDGPFRQPGVRLLKDSRSSTVAELEFLVNGVRRCLIYKRFRVTAWKDPWVSLLRRSPALRSWMFGHGFRERCLPTARPLAVLHRVQAGLKREGYLLAEKIEDAVDLHRFVACLGELPQALARRRLRLAIDSVAHTVRLLHRCRLSHRDLKASNLFLARDFDLPASPYRPLAAASPGAPIASILPLPASCVWVIDLVGVRLHSRLTRSRRVRNLARLHASFYQSGGLTRTDKLRFLRAYLLWNLRGRGAWKNWWRAVAHSTAAKVARNATRGRVLT
jgi:tRNA A-37 threonylcarbamoyl transferase component Bud32